MENMLKHFLQLKKFDPLLSVACIKTCISTISPKQWGKFHLPLNSAAVVSYSSTESGALIKPEKESQNCPKCLTSLYYSAHHC